MKKNCPVCGFKNKKTHKFCSECGAILTLKTMNEYVAQTKENTKNIKKRRFF